MVDGKELWSDAPVPGLRRLLLITSATTSSTLHLPFAIYHPRQQTFPSTICHFPSASAEADADTQHHQPHRRISRSSNGRLLGADRIEADVEGEGEMLLREP